MLEKLQNLDRRWVFLIVLFAVIIPLMFPLNMSIKTSRPVENVYNYIDKLPEGSTILMSFDFSPSTETELVPSATSIAQHAFKKNVNIVAIALWPEGGTMARGVLSKAAKKYNKEKNKNYVNLGYKAGGSVLLMAMKDGFAANFPTNIDGKPISDIPLMNKIKDYNNIDLVISFSAGALGLKEYILIVSTQFGVKVAGAVTGVSAPEMYTFLNSGQLLGLLGGLKGAAEYEHLLKEKGRATKAMDAQSVVHMVIVLFILFSNILYFIGEYRKKRYGK